MAYKSIPEEKAEKSLHQLIVLDDLHNLSGLAFGNQSDAIGCVAPDICNSPARLQTDRRHNRRLQGQQDYLPMVVMKLGVHASSQNRNSRHDLPTPMTIRPDHCPR